MCSPTAAGRARRRIDGAAGTARPGAAARHDEARAAQARTISAFPPPGERRGIATIDRPRFTRWGEARARGRGRLRRAARGRDDDRRRPSPRPRRQPPARRLPHRLGHVARRLLHHRLARQPQPHRLRRQSARHGRRGQCGDRRRRRHGRRLGRQGRCGAAAAAGGASVRRRPRRRSPTGFRAVRAAVDRIADWQPPLRTFKACFGATLACNAGPHQTDRGIADVTTGRLLDNPVLEVL